MSPIEFLNAYAERSHTSPERLLRRRVVVACDCDSEDCEGWALVPREFHAEDHAAGLVGAAVLR